RRMKDRRHELFADAALAAQQNGDIEVADAFDLFSQLAHRAALSDQTSELSVARARCFQQREPEQHVLAEAQFHALFEPRQRYAQRVDDRFLIDRELHTRRDAELELRGVDDVQANGAATDALGLKRRRSFVLRVTKQGFMATETRHTCLIRIEQARALSD